MCTAGIGLMGSRSGGLDGILVDDSQMLWDETKC